MSEEWKGRTVVVTGGTGGLGRAVVEELLEGGWRVRVPTRSEGGRERLLEHLGGPRPDLEIGIADVADAGTVEDFLGDAPLHALCNLAGGFRAAPVDETDPELWDRMIRMNATTAFVAIRAAVPRMRASGRTGRIVNVASFPGVERGAAGMSAYAAAKAAVVSLTHSLSKELRSKESTSKELRSKEPRPAGITVNAVAPEIIDTPANREAMPDADRSGWLDPAEIARVVAFLCSGDAGVVTGSVLTLARV